MPEEIGTDIPDIIQEEVVKIISKKRNAKRQNDCLRRPYKQLWKEVKSKGEKETYTHLNAEFRRRARRDKKALLSDKSKEIEENNGMG